MNDWQSIERAELEITGLTPGGGADGDSARVRVRLSAIPPFEWAETFRSPVDPAHPSTVHPILARDTVSFTVPESGLEDYIAVLDAMIGRANQRYREHVLPRVARHEAEAEERARGGLDRAAENASKLDALRERAKHL